MKKNKLLYLSLITVIISSIMVAINSFDTRKGLNMPTTQQNNQILIFTLNDMPINIDYQTKDTWYDMPMMTTEFEMNLKVPDDNGYKYEINFKEVKPGDTVKVKLDKLTKDSGIAIHITKKGSNDTHKYAIRSLNSTMPDFDVYYDKPQDGYYYFNCENFIIKMNTEGKIVFYKATSGYSIDFKRTEVNGKTYYSYFERKQPLLSNEVISEYNPSSLILMDEKYNTIDTVSNIIKTEKNNGSSLDWNDAIILDKGHYILMSYDKEVVNNIPEDITHSTQGTKVLASVIQEIKDNKVIFEWNSTDYTELYRYSNYNNDYINKNSYYSDYMHLNSINIDPKDNNIIVSIRNLDSIIKIDRNSGKILWILGGKGDEFNLAENQKTNKQHFAQYSENGTITVFDNGMRSVEGGFLSGYYQSYVKEYNIDEVNKQLVGYNEFKIEGRYSPIMGSAKRLEKDKNVFLIGWGGRASCTPLFSEEDFDTNKTIFEVNYNRNLKDTYTANSYRVYKDDK
ncbi:aryl-sulfate sulfotransferase [Clostridium neonatale]|uniref:aryl-sulfate sulfotransferase n=1 Tax=Clostridium neonatale TaxID=137838 RepID=UPI00291BB603|nr:arylsulfate sulfotransferase [Clostridium neonatale]CAI3669574.1 arylsulfate sulfotransferase [Clostridium neonatale]CAI3670296.1 arylsulfate sulfotransferase [Clostridium neonatale]CAI3686508.1 arylsulfate sulfotransferase [Clostridium neonatale]CAI3716433.1 arylsulfate sulfotransferase [Clostridium neonatale]